MKTKELALSALCIVLSACTAMSADPVVYLDWNAAKKQLVEVSITDYAVYGGETTLAAGTTYVVNKGGTLTDRLTVNGTAENPTRLILCDGVTFNVQKGITVYAKDETTHALVICGQKLGTGALTVTSATGAGNSAGIGGYYPAPISAPCGGIITINGGTVTVKGGGNGAGIGGGNGGTGGHVTINGGTVTVMGGARGAGIGGGQYGDGGTVTINGGVVTAMAGGDNGAGIGGGYNANGGAVTINGGTVTAKGVGLGAGIGYGVSMETSPRDGGTLTLGKGLTFSVFAGADESRAVNVSAAEYVADHPEMYVTMTPGCKLQIPVPEHYTYVVSNETAELNGTLANGVNTYEVAKGATVKVYFVLGEDCVWADASFDNPKTIASIKSDTVVDAKDLPKANLVSGTKTLPFDIGGGVTLWTNGTDFVIGGAGTIGVLSDVAELNPLLAGLTAITIDSNGVTGAVENAFGGIGEKIALTLPNGWQGELPDEDGNWYGLKVDLAAIPGAIMNMNFRQRYPWNGKLDITFDLRGEGKVKLVVSAFTNGVWICDATSVTGEMSFDFGAMGGITNGVKLVWDMAKDLPAGFKAKELTIEVAEEDVHEVVQLWKNGPYFATCNLGATRPEESGSYFWWGDTVGYKRNGSSWDAVDGSVKGFSFGMENCPVWNRSISWMKSNGWLDDSGNLTPAHDAVTAKLGDPWRMMTGDELKTLLDKSVCKMEVVKTYNGVSVYGLLITGLTEGYTDKSIFLPSAGCCSSGTGDPGGAYSYYWTSSPNANTSLSTPLSYARNLYFTRSGSYSADKVLFYSGCPVRPVRDTMAEAGNSLVSATGVVDLTVGDRVAADEETIVIDPAWGKATTATVKLQNGWMRTYTCSSNDLWDTTALTPGRHGLALRAGEGDTGVLYGAFFWKLGDGWVVLDGMDITANTTFEEGKTYLVLGTNTVADGVTLTVEDGAEFHYDGSAPAGFLGDTTVAELPKRYETVTVGGDLFQIAEKIKGCEDNPWDIGEGVTAYTNGTDLVIKGAGDKMKDFTAEDPAPWGTGITSITVDVASSLLALGANALSGCDAIEAIYVPYGTGEAYKAAEGWSAYADKIIAKGTKAIPFTNGAGLTAYFENEVFVIEGVGTVDSLAATMGDFWNDVKADIEAIAIAEVTVAIESDEVFKGVENLRLTLPDGWQGTLPDADGNWYGAKVDMTTFVYPLTVKNMKVQLHYPWDRLADVTFDVAGTGTVAVVVQVTANGVDLANPTVTGETTFDLGTGGESKNQKLIWNAGADFGDAKKHEKIRVQLSAAQAK